MSGSPGGERVIAGRYRLLSPLGEGGMGTVWRALDEVLRREVAVKEVRAPAGLPAGDVERLYARLEREAWAAARVANRNVVTVYDVATQEGRPWIVMELIRGITLADLLDAEGPLPPQRVALIGAEVLSALRAAHEAGVLHRDVKPGNVLMANDGRVVLTDFGIATVEGSSALTMTGEVVGSPEFLAPERALGRTPGPASDLWSLGVLLYAAVEGVSPFRKDTPLSTLHSIVDQELPPPHRAGPLAPVIEGLLRKDPAGRLEAEEAERELRAVGSGRAPRADGVRSAPPAPSASYAPTVAGRPQDGGGTPAQPFAAGTVPTREVADPRRRRAGLALVAGAAALALALAGLTYSLLNNDDGKKTGASRTESRTASAVAPAPSETGKPADTGKPSPTPTPAPSSPSPSSTPPPPQTVQVSVTGTRTDYTGTCPPAKEEAPVFTATFTVGRLPAEVDYRWVTANGEVVGGGWKTLSFPEGGARSGQDSVVLTTQAQEGTYSDRLGVEVREPVEFTSGSVAFSVTCVRETPTDGASPSPTPSQ
ncbi:serine/threonine-protein kinase [Streptomyces sp. NPDC093094]|uniref:serine/threonine-protein kinase n=1 Tax=Streptomyces sp. NPDC093094 TaxID=3366026 RepID=UPI0038124A5C